jgi:hypothetical protein
MLQATVSVTLDDLGNNVFRQNVTPGEARFLQFSFKNRAKGPVIHVLEETGSVQRTNDEEKQRLLRKYNRVKVEEAFPGLSPSFPEDFEKFPKGSPPAPLKQVKDDE